MEDDSRFKGLKRPLASVEGHSDVVLQRFKVLLPNGASVDLTKDDQEREISFQGFMDLIRDAYDVEKRHSGSFKRKGTINWKSKRLYLEDENGSKMMGRIDLRCFNPHKCHILQLHDGSGDVTNTFENMWDLTPDTDLLMELPEEYNFESALADLIDNSLQAVWLNCETRRRLISVDVRENRISIFDTGPGMDNSDENSIVKWGKMGTSLNRLYKVKAIGCKPPFLVPSFGMFGYGGPVASMHLGSCVIVSSKRKESKKVYKLSLSRDALLGNAGSQCSWRTDGGIRDPSDDEIVKSPHLSFTKVEILKPKVKNLDISKLRCKLKDIYFPYIQCDELSDGGKTVTPVEFQVNGVDLAGIQGGEVAITNLHSCNGPEFTVSLRFSLKKENSSPSASGSKAPLMANARLKFIYFPIRQGKESIERIIESLEAEGCGDRENFENYSRVSIRRLGRLLPDARWASLPFMDLRQRKGENYQLLKRCCLRVKCFVETDAGFNPMPSKTDLAHHNPFSIALKNFGSRPQDKEKDVNVEIHRDEKQLTYLQLEREYMDWLLQMHRMYDEEIESGEDQPIIIVNPLNKKALGISSDVIRVHQILKRKRLLWKSGQKIKVLKGACTGCHKNNVYATIEHFLLEGFQGDSGGEARIICRPLGVENGCKLSVKGGTPNLDIQDSLSLPISVIDSQKCKPIDDSDWELQVKKQIQKNPSRIELLNVKQCHQLEVDGALPTNIRIHAGQTPPKVIVAVFRPSSFTFSLASYLDQKDIVKVNLEMSMEVTFRRTKNHQDFVHIYSVRIAPSSFKGFHGLYMFSLGVKFRHLFQKAGAYTFSFSAEHSGCPKYKQTMMVVPSEKVGKWELLRDEKFPSYTVRVGSCFPPLSLACYDIYDNQMSFTSFPSLKVKLSMNEDLCIDVVKMKPSLSSDNLVFIVKDIVIECYELDSIRPNYAATLMIYIQDESTPVSVGCQVTPGDLHSIKVCSQLPRKQLLPGFVVEQFLLEVFDVYGNHVEEGFEVQFQLNGFSIQGQIGSSFKVDNHGCIDLGGLLKVTTGYGKQACLSVLHDDKVIFKQDFQTEKRELRISSSVPEQCIAGSSLENIGFEVVDFNGDVDKTFHHDEKCGQSHTLVIKSESFEIDDSIRYVFKHGLCNITSFPLPQIEGPLFFKAFHSHYSQLCCDVKIYLVHAPIVNDEEAEVHTSDGKISHAPKVENSEVESHTSCGKELGNEVLKSAERVGKRENYLKELNRCKTGIEQQIFRLQASLEPDLVNNLDCLSTKEELMKLIKGRGQTAAAILCSLAQGPPMHITEDVVGVVALLGTVCSVELSRILAEYLGEDQMLAVVCKSYHSAGALEQYGHNGKVDSRFGLHAEATALGKSLSDRFFVVCLEDISPYLGGVEFNDPQRKLVLPIPSLPFGHCPPGFIGYAVNMINLDNPNYRTDSGYGFRETLFYRLFGKVQVYDTRENMERARSCIKHGAVSLDGGILRKNGLISLGFRSPEIYFRVENRNVSPQSQKIMDQIKEKQNALTIILQHIDESNEKLKRDHLRLDKKKTKFRKCMDNTDNAINNIVTMSPLQHSQELETPSQSTPR
ncbi:structural maintenance of chromosomes flexible hinge domain-containing protein GMI1-like isoform X2 [Hibiscus syriacus]|uniref:structural maintenance of chromosomes flexible hinge domain-containing protein GMI1-like isoform X2 n=1 Tax=Hibiscus syriacus TaxID=106335 RepID=UPI001921BE12|nr:structural maintenance of chromosomes flexible hinge domain-containing protein GMI1-like isoform X2 [Hibiscus syriacus]